MLIKALTRENLELRNVRYLGESDEQNPQRNARKDLSKVWGEGDLNCNPSKGKEPGETAAAGIVDSPTRSQGEPLLASSASAEPPEKVAAVAAEPHGTNDVQQWPPFLQENDGMIHVGYGVWITCKAWGVCKARPVLSKKGEDPEIKYCKNVCYAVVGDKIMERSITGNTAPKFKGINEPKQQLTPEKYKAIYGKS
ncbi:uncharacterized protein LOC124172334 [Ischnura elegans]|uniref:uncharacterized protein LOC124172334 n=1 Tax=Ischnura elegans TaxID=197161 RepID=UPI001ED89875|nr:uncharacterized protein LOC124172334 [Ischnura elegans]